MSTLKANSLTHSSGSAEIIGLSATKAALTGCSSANVGTLTSASTITIDFGTANHFKVTLGENTRFNNPANTENVGQSGTITITQDGTGSRTAAWGTSGATSQYKWVGGTAPTLSSAANAVDRIDYVVTAADTIHCVASLDVK